MSTSHIPKVVLGSRSPRRRELLGSVVSDASLLILPPASPHEPGFSDVSDEAAIEHRLCEIVELKHTDVCRQVAELQHTETFEAFIVVADTIVIADGAGDARQVLGQPDPDKWPDDVRAWFRDWLSGRTHDVWTGVRISRGKEFRQFVIRSKVTFGTISNDMLNWYLSTGESLGKAGGYAIQGHAAAFVTELNGSLTSVIGLPLLEVIEGLTELGWCQSER